MRVEVLKQLSVFLPNRPGALSALARIFSDQGVNILGVASEVRDDTGVVRVAVDPKAKIEGLLSKAGFASVETSVLSVTLPDKPGELLRVTRALAEARLNITTVYATADGSTSRMLIAAENTDKARAVLESLP